MLPLEHLPEFITPQDLVDLGIFPTLDATYLARLRKNSPPFIKLKHKILYQKKDLIEWLEHRTVRFTEDEK